MRKKKKDFHSITKEWKAMCEALEEIPSKKERELLKLQLVWLKKQIDYYEFVDNLPKLMDCYREVDQKFNRARNQ